jgi:hypothetical protein
MNPIVRNNFLLTPAMTRVTAHPGFILHELGSMPFRSL